MESDLPLMSTTELIIAHVSEGIAKNDLREKKRLTALLAANDAFNEIANTLAPQIAAVGKFLEGTGDSLRWDHQARADEPRDKIIRIEGTFRGRTGWLVFRLDADTGVEGYEHSFGEQSRTSDL